MIYFHLSEAEWIVNVNLFAKFLYKVSHLLLFLRSSTSNDEDESRKRHKYHRVI